MNQPRNGARVLDDVFNGLPPAWERRLLAALLGGLTLAVAAGGCGGESETGSTTKGGGGNTSEGGAQGGGGQGGAGPGGSMTGGNGTGAGGTTTSTGGSGGMGTVIAPICAKSCQTSADCDQGSAAFDADNYKCTAGVCEFLGCKTDAECKDTFDTSYVCASESGYPTPICALGCQTNADCDQGSAAFDADNYKCTGGGCEYVGCKTDTECKETFGDSHVCLADSGYPQPTCAKSCQTNADCDLGSAAFGADNYACTGGGCKFLGCNADAECQDTFDPSYVCP